MICNFILILGLIYSSGGLVLFYFKNQSVFDYNFIHREYLNMIQKHNYCACQTLNSRVCNTWKRIQTLDTQMKTCKKDINNVQWLLNKWTFGLYKYKRFDY